MRWLISAVLLGTTVLMADDNAAPKPNPALENALRAIVRQGAVPGWTVPDGSPARVCSVPLVEMPIPSDKRYTMKELHLTNEVGGKSVVPVEGLPAPPCEGRK